MWRAAWNTLLLAQAPVASQSAPASQPAPILEVVGRVTDLAGAPIAGASLLAGSASELTTASTVARPDARSGSDGRFALRTPCWYPDTPEGPGPTLLVAAPGRASAWIELPLVSVEDLAAPVDLGAIALPPGRTVGGIVTGKDGRPVAGAAVHVADALTPPSWRGAHWGGQARSAENGVFSLAGAVVGPLVLTVRAEGFAQRTLPAVLGNDLVTVEQTPTGFVSGRVARARTAPPFRGSVRLVSEWFEDGPPVRVGDGGDFRLPIPWLGRFPYRGHVR